MQLELTQALITGHAVIDAEHRRIIEAINTIIQAAKADGEAWAFQSLLENFVALCAEHFRSEEAILAQARYPQLAGHTAYHEAMLAKARDVQALCLAADSPAARLRHLEDMVGCLVDDIVRSDLTFVSYLQAAGVSSTQS